MKKFLCFLAALMLLLLSGCGEAVLPQDISAEQVLEECLKVGENPEISSEYLKSKNNFDSFKMSLWADGIYAECPEAEMVSDYAIVTGSAKDTFEISVLKADNAENAKQLRAVLQRRKQTISGSDNSNYDPNFTKRFENLVIKEDGLFVMLIMTEDNSKRLEQIEKLKKSWP